VTSVLRDRDGAHWISTRHGLALERGGVVSSFPGGVAGDRLLYMSLEDNEGGLWFASSERGLLRLPAGWQRFAVFRGSADSAAASPMPVHGSALGRDGRVWLVGFGGGVGRMDPASGVLETVLDLSRQTSVSRLWSVLESSDGSLWVGHARGVSRYRNGRWRHWLGDVEADGLLAGPVRQLAEGADGTLWLGSYGGGVQARDREGRVLHSFEPGDGHGVDSPEQNQLATGPDGALWLAGPKGLRRWDADAGKFLEIPGAPLEQVYGFALAAPDIVWLHRLSALEAYRWNGRGLSRLRAVDADDGLPAVESGGLMVDRAGIVWLTTARGLLRYDPAAASLRMYGVRVGLPSQGLQLPPPLLLPSGRGALRVGIRAGPRGRWTIRRHG